MESWFNSRLRLQQDTQCTYNEILRCVQVTIVAAENLSVLQILSECFTLSNPACKAHAPYYILICGLSHFAVNFTLIELCNISKTIEQRRAS